jgi:hypothetical protein
MDQFSFVVGDIDFITKMTGLDTDYGISRFRELGARFHNGTQIVDRYLKFCYECNHGV